MGTSSAEYSERLRHLLSKLAPEKILGAGGLSVLCAASALALGADPTVPTALARWIGGMGLNVLASVLQQHYQRLLSRPNLDEQEQLGLLSQALAQDIRRQAKLRREVGAFLNTLDSVRIAEEVVRGNQAVHGWLLAQIYKEVEQYRVDFEQIHQTLTEIKTRVGEHGFALSQSAQQAYLEKVLSQKHYSRWASGLYLDGKARHLPLNISPYYPQTQILLSQQRKLDLIQAIEAREQVIILGDPGAGKTTALERLMFEQARKSLSNEEPSLLPVYIPLKSYNGQTTLIPLVRAAFNESKAVNLSEGETEDLLRDNICLVLCDGLNEITSKFRDQGVAVLLTFLRTYPHHRYVITCRTYDYHAEFGEIDALIIQELGDGDVQRYLCLRLGEKDGRHLYENLGEHVQELVRTPLMLQMISEVGLRASIPRNKGEIFQNFFAQLLWREASKGDRACRFPATTKQGILAELAFAMQTEKTLEYPRRQVQQIFVGYLNEWQEPFSWREIFHEVMLNGLLRESGLHATSFLHQLYQDYFAALKLREKLDGGEDLSPYWTDPYWLESATILIGLVEDSLWADKKTQVMALISVGQEYINMGNYGKAIYWNELTVELARTINDPDALVLAIQSNGLIYSYRCEYDQAIARFEEAKSIALAAGRVDLAQSPLHFLGKTLFEKGQFERALEIYEENWAFERARGNPTPTYILLRIAEVELAQGKVKQAREHLAASARAFRQGTPSKRAWWHVVRLSGKLHEHQGRPKQAHKRFLQALRLAEESTYDRGVTDSLYDLAEICYLMGSYRDALGYCQAALRRRNLASELKGKAEALRLLGQIQQQLGHKEAARESLQQSITLFRKLGLRRHQLAAEEDLNATYS